MRRKLLVKVTEEMIRAMKRMHAEGYMNKEIAEELGLTGDTVGRYLNPMHKVTAHTQAPKRKKGGWVNET